jgi:hypothetical protein
MAKGQKTKRQTIIYDTLHIQLTIEQHEPHEKPWVKLKTTRRMRSFCSHLVHPYCYFCHKSVANHEWEKNGIVITKEGTDIP